MLACTTLTLTLAAPHIPCFLKPHVPSDNRHYYLFLGSSNRGSLPTPHAMSDTHASSQHIGHVDALNLTVSLYLYYTLCIALTRFWIRRGAFGFDDVVVLTATLVTLGHTGTSYAALSYGLGNSWSEISESGKLPELNTVGLDHATKTRLQMLTTS